MKKMYKVILTSLLILPALAQGQARDAETLLAEGLKKYTLESGEIHYALSGDATGEELMVFAAYGWKSLRKRTMTFELYGISDTQTLIEVTDGDFSHRLSEQDSTYQTRSKKKWSELATYKTPEQTSEAILFGMGGTYSGYTTLLEKNCQIWTFEGKAVQELWIWNGLVMKRKAQLGDKIITTTATRMELTISPPPDIFEIPEYYKNQD